MELGQDLKTCHSYVGHAVNTTFGSHLRCGVLLKSDVQLVGMLNAESMHQRLNQQPEETLWLILRLGRVERTQRRQDQFRHENRGKL